MHGDLGQSFIYRQDVSALLAPRAANTIRSSSSTRRAHPRRGRHPGSGRSVAARLGIGATILAAVGIATPVFVAAIMLITVFAVELGWFPVFGSGEGLIDRLWHLTLPAVALVFPWSPT